ncbi:hypothetical protein H4Q26_010369 [Puccinia striiformis f. sp. tritici PST-130]|nr:hypothetical protein H4Q26_010369 [Puccinia striiformis f. sp. tritici PST-130]
MSNIPSMNPSIQITPWFARRARGRQDPTTGPLRIQSQTLVDNITHNDSLGDPDMQSDHEQESIISDPVNAQRTMESPPLEEVRAATNMSSVRASLGLDEAAFHRAEVLSAAVRMDPWMATSMMYVAVNHRIEQLTTTVQNLRLGAATPLTQPMGEVRVSIPSSSSAWDIIDRHLEVMRRQSRDYKFAYGRLLLEIDEEVFNGINTAADVALIALELPTEQDVRDLLARRAAVPAIIEVEERQAQGEIF